jgi:hypothetical protein
MIIMSTSAPYIGSAEHTEDLGKIYATERAERAERVFNYEASSQDVIDWYGTEDTLGEQDTLMYLQRLYNSTHGGVHNFRENMRTNVLAAMRNEAAALTILATEAGMTRGGSVDNPWYERARTGVATDFIIAPEQLKQDAVDGILSDISKHELETLYVATDCLYTAGKEWGALSLLMKRDTNAFPEHEQYEQAAKRNIWATYQLTKAMYESILKDKSHDELVAARPMLHKLTMLAASINFEQGSAEREAHQLTTVAPSDKVAFRVLTYGIDTSFLALDDAPVVKGTEKGDLHELMFMLDLNYLFTTKRTEGNEWIASATTDREDHPENGNPSRRRGFDYLVSNGSNTLSVQVKANKAQEEKRKQQDPNYREYHPWIRQYAEANFQFVKKATLEKKIQAYMDWIESDFDPAYQQKLDRYVLPTAREVYADAMAEEQMPKSERVLRYLGGQLTRAERRRIQRNYGAFKKRNNQK